MCALKLYTAEEAAGFIKLSKVAIYELVKAGRLDCVNIGGIMYFQREALEKERERRKRYGRIERRSRTLFEQGGEKKVESTSQLSATDVLDYVQDVMKEESIRGSQKIDSLLDTLEDIAEEEEEEESAGEGEEAESGEEEE